MELPDPSRRRFPVAFLVLAVVMAIPLAPLVLRGGATIITTLGVVMAFDPVTAVLFSALLLPRILGSLWAYFKVDNTWGNEVAYMAFFLWFPLIAVIFYALTARNLRTPPRGYEWATIKGGVVHQPIYEHIGPQAMAPPQGPAPQGPSASYYQERPPTPPPPFQSQRYHPQGHSPREPSPQGHPPQGYPPQWYQQQGYQRQDYPSQGSYHQGHPPQGYQGQHYPPPGYSQQPYAPPQWAQHMYSQQPYGTHSPPPTAFPQAQVPYAYQAPRPREWGPGPEWKKVGERTIQKRDYLVWHNVVLLIINAMMLASFVLGLIIYPFIFSMDGIDEAALVEFPSDAGFVLFTLIIQDGILIWMVWHQVVRRRVIPLTEMGISRKTLADGPKMARHTAWGVVIGLALFAVAVAIELGQTAVGFVPPEDAIIVGPEAGDLVAYMTWLVSACLIAPVSEEFFFRGYAFYAFNKRHGLFVALFVSAIGFSAIHGSIYSLLPIFAAGVGLALAYHRTGSLVPPMVAHAVNNFIAVTLMYLGA